MQKCASRLGHGAVLMVVSALLAIVLVSSASAASRQTVWQSRDQFVALERLEPGAEGPNAHPVEMTPETLTTMLAAIDIRNEDSTGTEALFSQGALQLLVPQLQQALRKASAQDDVTFAVIGLHSALYGLAKSPKVTTGRMFFRNGRLNLIVGMAQHDVNEREDRRLAPFIPGSRRQTPAREWQLLPRAGQDVFTLKRKDWIVFNDAATLMNIVAPEVSKSAVPHHTPIAPPRQAPAESRNPVERMMILNELKNKGLISDEEYRGKRQQILDGL
jgi:hypothetical protein